MVTVHIVIFEDVDEFEVCAPYELLTSCKRLVNGHWGDKPVFRVEIIADHNATVKCAHGLQILPQKAISNAFDADVVIVPGGPGTRKERHSHALLEYLGKAWDTARIISSISSGAFLLGKAGLLDNRRVATHPVCAEELARTYPKAFVVTDRRVVADGTDDNLLLTTSAISSGVDLALAIIDKYEGHDTAVMAARRIGWSPSNIG